MIERANKSWRLFASGEPGLAASGGATAAEAYERGEITLSRLAEETGLGREEAARVLEEAGAGVRVPGPEDVAAQSGLA